MVKEKISAPKDAQAAENVAQNVCDIHSVEALFPPVDDSCELTVACFAEHYSASRIARAIEDCDAHLLNLNITSRMLDNGEMTILLRVGLRNPDSAVRSLERYGYRVIAIHSGDPEPLADSLSARISEVLHIIQK